MMWQEGEAEERIQERDLQGTTEKGRKKTQMGHVSRDIFLVVDEIVPNFERNKLTTAKFGIKDKEIKMCLQALFWFCSILLCLYS